LLASSAKQNCRLNSKIKRGNKKRIGPYPYIFKNNARRFSRDLNIMKI
jgi:hypothetical protein